MSKAPWWDNSQVGDPLSKPDSSDFKVSVTIETDPGKYDTFPYHGQISASYRIDKKTIDKDGRSGWWESDELTADYRYSASERK